MSKIISIHSYRGGTGKSNVTANLAWLMAREGHRIGVIDTDLQSPGIHMVLGFDTKRITHTLSDYLFGKCEVEDAAYDLSTDLELDDGKLILLPASMSVEAITRILSEGYDITRLSDQLRGLTRVMDLDYLLIDTHPGLNRETMLNTAVADCLILMIRPDTQDFHGTAVVMQVARRLGVPKTFMIANKVVSSTVREKMRKQIESAFHVDMLGLLPLSEDMASLGSRGLFAKRYPEHPIAVEMRSITARLLRELEA